jgi:hypothetical protein
MRKTLMRIAGFILAGVTTFSIYGCCKERCSRSQLPLLFLHFNHDDVDTVLLIKFEPNGQFINKIDSFYEYLPQYAANVQPFDSITHYVFDIDLRKDWEIKLPALNKTYQVSGIETANQSCNCGRGSTKVISAYKLQAGNLLHQEYVVIEK